jgi:hypothetical protein
MGKEIDGSNASVSGIVMTRAVSKGIDHDVHHLHVKTT